MGSFAKAEGAAAGLPNEGFAGSSLGCPKVGLPEDLKGFGSEAAALGALNAELIGSVFVAAEGAAAHITKANMLQISFGTVFGETLGNVFVAVCLMFFAFTTILSWNFFGKVNFEHLFGKKATIVYSVLALAFIFVGSVFPNDLVWELTDMFNNLMVLPNVVALAALTGIVVKASKTKLKGAPVDEDQAQQQN